MVFQHTSRLRQAELPDSPILAHLMNMVSEGALAVRFGQEAMLDESWLDVARRYVSSPTSELSYTNCIVYEVDTDIAGMMLLNWLSSGVPELDFSDLDEKDWPANELIFKVPGSMLIRELGVFEKYRRKGIAGTLLGLAESYAISKSIPMLSLTVHESSKEAIALYEQFGFELKNSCVITKHEVWNIGSRLYLMTKSLA